MKIILPDPGFVFQKYHQRDQRNCNDQQPDYSHQDNRHNNRPCPDNKDSKSSKSYKKMMIASTITSKKRATRPCTMTNPLH